VLKSLPRGTFEDTTPLDLIANGAWDRVKLYTVQHPLLDDARYRFKTGFPDRHVSASRTYGEAVYEVRERGGAAWRGLVVMDAEGDPWLVWAERHDQFAKHAGSVQIPKLLPTAVEYKLRDREEAAQRAGQWRKDVLTAFVRALRDSIRTGETQSVTIPGLREGESAVIEVEAIHDEPAPAVDQAHTGQSVMCVSLKIRGKGWNDFEAALVNVCLPFLEPDHTKVQPVMGKDGLTAMVDITHAQIVQLIADPPTYDAERPAQVAPRDRLHYVGSQHLLESFVDGTPVRGVCGIWFVASHGEECGLPICSQCEAEQPMAQAVLDLLRSRNDPNPPRR